SYFLDDNGDGYWGITPNDHETSGGSNDPYTDRIYVMAPTNDTPGTQGLDDFFNSVLSDGSNVANWTSVPGENDPGGPMDTWNVFSRIVFMNWNGGDVADHPNYNALEPETGTIFRIVTTKPNNSKDEYTFSTTSIVGKTIEYDPDKIKVWPNPYFAFNPEEKSSNDRQIHFTHLPEEGKCILRIFDLAGTLVRKLEHNNGTQFEIWDVRDYHTNPVASGMYIVHIETEQGEKILKLAVIQPTS
ncbi:MAG: T9SS type A sorting domain-containing protein, partial [Candidatus Neomarinimicrobiota bacterium]